MWENLGGTAKVLEYWNAAAPHLQARYCHSTLGTKIKIERIGNLEYFDQKIVASSGGLNTVRSHGIQVRGSADLVVYMAYDEYVQWDSNHASGIAWLSSVCSPSSWDHLKMSINEWQTYSVGFGSVSTTWVLGFRKCCEEMG